MLGRQGRRVKVFNLDRTSCPRCPIYSSKNHYTRQKFRAKASKLIPKGALKAIAKPFSKIPIMGPLILTVSSLAGEPLVRHYSGVVQHRRLLGTATPIPVIGTLLEKPLVCLLTPHELTMGGGPGLW